MFSLTGAWEGAGTGRAGSGRKVSALAMSASISWRMRSRLVGRSEMRSLKGAARASFSSAAFRLASFHHAIATGHLHRAAERCRAFHRLGRLPVWRSILQKILRWGLRGATRAGGQT